MYSKIEYLNEHRVSAPMPRVLAYFKHKNPVLHTTKNDYLCKNDSVRGYYTR